MKMTEATRKFVAQGLKQHNAVEEFRVDECQYTISRRNLPDVCVLILDVYDLTAEQAREAIGCLNGVQAIVRTNPYARTSSSASCLLDAMGIEDYTWRKFFGVLNKRW